MHALGVLVADPPADAGATPSAIPTSRRAVPSLEHADGVRGDGRCRWFAAAGQRMARQGDGRRGGQPRVQPRVSSRAQPAARRLLGLSLIHISEPTRLLSISYAV